MFKTFSFSSGIWTHAHTRVPDFSTEDFLKSGALDHSVILPGLRRHFSVWSVIFQFGWIWISEIYSAKRFVSSTCKDLRSNPRVHSCFTCLFWLTFFVHSNHSVINHRLRCVFFLLCTVILNWRSSMTEFVSWRLCLIVFKRFSDRSGIRTHAQTRVPEFSTEEFLESSTLDRSAILPGLRRHFSVWSVIFQLGWIWISEIYSAKRFVSSTYKDLRLNTRVQSCFTCLFWVSFFVHL